METNSQKDRFGMPLKIGDTVVVSFLIGRSSVHTVKDEVVGFTPKKVKLAKHGTRDNSKVVLYTAQEEYNYNELPEYII